MDHPQNVMNGIIVLGILAGALQCFFGYRIFKIILMITGFLLGGALACAIGYTFSNEEIIALITGLIGGIIGAVLMAALYFAGVFLIGALLGGLLGAVLFALAQSPPEPAVLFILAIIAGAVALVFQKFMIIVSTGFGGAWGIAGGIAYFTTDAIDPANIERMFRYGGKQLYVILFCWLVLGIAGVIVQYKSVPAPRNNALPSSADQ